MSDKADLSLCWGQGLVFHSAYQLSLPYLIKSLHHCSADNISWSFHASLARMHTLTGSSAKPQDSLLLVREPAVGLIMWLRPKGLKVCSYAEKNAKFKNQTLIKIR